MGDAFGRALLDQLEHGGDAGLHIVERNDGFVEPASASVYFGTPGDWASVEATAAALAGDTILDVGAGAGRHSLAFQEMGRNVVALDPSPGAAQVCRRRGVHHVIEATIDAIEGTFDSFTFFGNNLGMLTAHPSAFLPSVERLGAKEARVIGTIIDPYRTTDPCHLHHHERNRAAGRYGGWVTLRIRYRDLATDWWDLLWASQEELIAILEPTGWRVTEIMDEGEPIYAAVLQRSSRHTPSVPRSTF